ncbi:MAG: DUF1302 family protein [Pseudomonadota bacterium]
MMVLRACFTSTALACFWPAFLLAGEFAYRGDAREIFAADMRHDDPAERFVESNLHLFAEGRYTSGGWSATASLLGRVEVMAPRGTKTRYRVDLYEAYIRRSGGDWAFEGGERVLRWGVMEYLSPTDALNPHDFSQLTDPDVEDRYLPVPMLRIVAEPEPWTLEAVYQPFFRASRIDWAGTDAAVYRPSLTSHFGLPFVDFSQVVGGSAEDHLSGLVARDPDDNPAKGDAGARISWRSGDLDLSAVYLYKRDPLPTFNFSNGAQALNPAGLTPSAALLADQGFFPRAHLAGGTLRWVFDSGFTLKGEGLYKSNASFYDAQLFLVREPELQWTAGIDYDWNLQHLFTVEYAQDRAVHSGGRSFFARDRVQHLLSAAAILNFDARTWSVEFKGTTIVNQHAYFIDPRLLYRPTPPWEFALGANFWGGFGNSLFGLISNNDEIFVSAKYFF